MEHMAASEFKTHCLAVLQKVRKTRKPVCITRYGKVVAEIRPPSPPAKRKSWLGSMAGTVDILGDIVGPTTDPSDWDALR